MICDGCQSPLDPEQAHLVSDYGHECRFCSPCREHYVSFVTACSAKEASMQFELNEWIKTTRGMCPLLLTPSDLAASRFTPSNRSLEGLTLG